MNDELRALSPEFQPGESDFLTAEYGQPPLEIVLSIPDYLQDTYGWAYLHPKSFLIFEHEWVVNLILWGNMKRLTDAVLEEIDLQPQSRVLQVACVYGDFSNRLATHLEGGRARLEVLDVAPIQINNARKKLSARRNVSFHHQDSSSLSFPDASHHHTVVFFLLHEQPEKVCRKTIAEAIRVTRPGGKVIFVDYHGPKRSNPMRYLMKPVLAWLEPFALKLWCNELPAYMPANIKAAQIESTFYFGGLYQKVVLTV